MTRQTTDETIEAECFLCERRWQQKMELPLHRVQVGTEVVGLLCDECHREMIDD